MELLELLEWLLSGGLQEELSRRFPGAASNEEELFQFIRTMLEPYLHAFSLLVGITGQQGTILQWWQHLPFKSLPQRVNHSLLAIHLPHVFKITGPDRKDALLAALYNNGIREMLLLPLYSGQRSFGFLCLLTDNTDTFTPTIVDVVKNAAQLISAACLRVLLHNSLGIITQPDLPVQMGMIGGKNLQPAIDQVMQVAPTDATVLLTGETGTGKEVFARAIHGASARSGKAMVKVNCAALPAQLVESELFGHERGAFTGALQRRIGKFEQADGSTLFLDEVGELPLDLQAKLLRALQEREIERLGGDKTIKVDVRIVAATNRVLEDEVKAGRFRLDLYYRLFVFPIHLPPLRERREDIPALLQHFVMLAAQKYGKPVKGLEPRSVEVLTNYSWPGNIRELEHLVERSVISSTGPVVKLATPVHMPAPASSSDTSPPPLQSLADSERDVIIRTLKYCNGRIRGQQGAAEILDVKPTTLEARMKKLGITRAHISAP
jgi:transcriptional regulator with GAF, ATPase, and Fis domain